MKKNLVLSVINQLGYSNDSVSFKSVSNGYVSQFEIKNDDLKSELSDISNYGVQGGFGGFIYYTETVEFFNKNKKDIIEMAEQQADDFGSSLSDVTSQLDELDTDKDMKEVKRFLFNNFSSKAVAMILGFNEWKNVGDLDQLKNLLTWYAAEETARFLTDF